jgi:hypothetical protein
MGDETDHLLDRLFDAYFDDADYNYGVGPECKKCHSTDVDWEKDANDKWVLCNPNGVRHACGEDPDADPIAAFDDLELEP